MRTKSSEQKVVVLGVCILSGDYLQKEVTAWIIECSTCFTSWSYNNLLSSWPQRGVNIINISVKRMLVC